MKITYHIEGGIAHFPGLAKPRTIELDRLPKRVGAELRSLGERALAAPGGFKSIARGADMRTFVVTIDDGRKSRTLSIVEPAADPDLARLIEKLQSAAP
jgi:hypothetical protein